MARPVDQRRRPRHAQPHSKQGPDAALQAGRTVSWGQAWIMRLTELRDALLTSLDSLRR